MLMLLMGIFATIKYKFISYEAFYTQTAINTPEVRPDTHVQFVCVYKTGFDYFSLMFSRIVEL